MKTATNEKPALVPLTDPLEIESVRRNGDGDIFGFISGATVWAYKWSVERWRKLHSEPLR